ncbi:MAG: hypothetical protein ABUS47_13395 [Steroidobacter sp.]
MTHRDDMPDDPSFEKHLKRGSDLSQRYKASSHDEVPPELDKKILMQAREAVSDKQVVTHHSWWIRWNKPLALAASLMLAFTVIYRVGHQSIDELASPAPEAPAVAQQQTTAGKVAEIAEQSRGSVSVERKSDSFNEPKPAPEKDTHDTKSDITSSALRSLPSAAAPPVPAPVVVQAKIAAAPMPAVQAPAALPSTAPSTTDKTSASTAGANSESETRTHTSPAAVDSITADDIGRFPDNNVSGPLQRIPGVEIKQEQRNALKKKQDSADPEQLLQQIRDLRAQGKKKQADKAWKQFRKDFPDYPVAEDDKARGESR